MTLDSLLEKFQQETITDDEKADLIIRLQAVRDMESNEEFKGDRIAAAIILRYIEIQEN